MSPTHIETIATVLFALAVLHTFASSQFQHVARKYPEGSVGENLFHLLGEVEIVFGLWAAFLIVAMTLTLGTQEAVHYAESLNFNEPLFVFAIMAVASTRPVIELASRAILSVSRLLPIHRETATYISCLAIGPLLGSFITEPAAMTVTALILSDRYFNWKLSDRFKYATLAVLFVNVSIGGVLTPFAAPPVLMVAGKWKWDLAHMMSAFGWKSALATVLNAVGAAIFLRDELRILPEMKLSAHGARVPAWLTVLHLLFLILIVVNAHHPVIFIGLFLFFMGVVTITREYQEELRLRESLLVAFFLGGLVVLGGLQRWWLDPVIRSLDALPLFLGTTALTGITDNAALTYLGSQVEGVSEGFKYALVAGAIAGGGLTVIANAPNPAGFAILQDRFGPDGISPLRLFLAALLPTLIGMSCLWLLP